MDKPLQAAIANHRNVVAGHSTTPHTMPLESVTICLLAEVHDALMANKAARPAKKAQKAK